MDAYDVEEIAVSKWVVGEGVAVEDLESRLAAMASVEAGMSDEETEKLVAAVLRWGREHGPNGLVTVIAFPPGTDPEKISALIPEAPPNLHAGIGVLVTRIISLPTGTFEFDPEDAKAIAERARAFVRAGPPRIHFRWAGGEPRPVSRQETVEREIEVAETQVRILMGGRTYEWRVWISGPDGTRLTDEELADVEVFSYADSWLRSGRSREGHMIVPAARPGATQTVRLYARTKGGDLAGMIPLRHITADEERHTGIRLAPVGEIRGRILTPDGRPARGITVRLLLEEERPYPWRGTELTVTQAGADGIFSFRGIPLGAESSLEVYPELFLPYKIEIGKRRGDLPMHLGDLRLETPGTVYGVVLDGDDKPVKGALVYSSGPYAWTDEMGRFAIRGVPRRGIFVAAQKTDGDKQLFAAFESRDWVDFVALILAPEFEDLQVRRQAPRVRVEQWMNRQPPDDLDRSVRFLYFVDEERHPQHGEILKHLSRFDQQFRRQGLVTAVIYPPGTTPDTIRADMLGLPRPLLAGVDEPIEGIPGAGWTLAMRMARDRVPHTLTLADRVRRVPFRMYAKAPWEPRHPSDELVQELLDAVDLDVTVLDPDRKPLAGAWVTPASSDSYFDLMVETDEDGKAFIPAVRGRQPMPVYFHHLERGLVGHIDARGAGRVEAVARLAHPPPMTGRVVMPDGEPVANAHVYNSVKFAAEGRPSVPLRSRRAFVTEADGKFRFDYIPDGAEGTLTVRVDGYGEATVPVKGHERELGDIVLPSREGEATFRVVDIDGNPVSDLRVRVGRRVGLTDATGEWTVRDLPDEPVEVTISGSGWRNIRHVCRPGRHTLVTISNRQDRELQLVLRPDSTRPPWRVSEWLRATDPPFNESYPWLAVVAGEELSDEELERLARWLADVGESIPNLALILPHRTRPATAERIAETLDGFTVGFDETFEHAPDFGYSELVRNFRGPAEIFTGYLSRFPNNSHSIRGRRSMDEALEEADTLLEGWFPGSREEALAARAADAEASRQPSSLDLAMRLGLDLLEPAQAAREGKSALGLDGRRVAGVAIWGETVVVGTDRGLLMYVPATRTWRQALPDGDYRVMDLPVKSVERQDDRLIVVFVSPDGEEITRMLGGLR